MDIIVRLGDNEWFMEPFNVRPAIVFLILIEWKIVLSYSAVRQAIHWGLVNQTCREA